MAVVGIQHQTQGVKAAWGEKRAEPSNQSHTQIPERSLGARAGRQFAKQHLMVKMQRYTEVGGHNKIIIISLLRRAQRNAQASGFVFLLAALDHRRRRPRLVSQLHL